MRIERIDVKMNENSKNSSIIHWEGCGITGSVKREIIPILFRKWNARLNKTEYVEKGKIKTKTEYDIEFDCSLGDNLNIRPFNKKDDKLTPGRIFNDYIGMWDNNDKKIDEKRFVCWVNKYRFPPLPLDKNTKLNLKESPHFEHHIFNNRIYMTECTLNGIIYARECPQHCFDVLDDLALFRYFLEAHIIDVTTKCYKGHNTKWQYRNSTFVHRIAENGRYKTITTYSFENVIDLILFDLTQIMSKTDKRIDTCPVCKRGLYISINNKKHCSYCGVSKTSTKDAIKVRVKDFRKKQKTLQNLVIEAGQPPDINRSAAKWQEYWSGILRKLKKTHNDKEIRGKKNKSIPLEKVISDMWETMQKNKLLP